ncbi:U1 small nuclear ribonucleoprotein of 70kDa MW N terminal-domain-containing protein [Kockiozyma suomiensis]|uniref:U1 small nuclear ribonucleoprotein of 70kDa MW N terminal-domain-containing protein n=1 Tax=Kockiozyma suomiensis TaxID=1337062 RepID=UPI003343ABD3
MTDKLPPPLLALFAPRPPLRYLPPTDTAPEKRATAQISGVSKYLELLNTPDPTFQPTETKLEESERRKREAKEAHEKRLQEGLEKWDPKNDPLVKGDPFQTLFIARLAHDVTEKDLDDELSKYGRVERIRIVREKSSSRPRGYAFAVFAREQDMRAAYKDLNGSRLKNRRILVDVERGRTVKNWKPRRLGGGLGGRHYTKAGLLRSAGRDTRDKERERERERDSFRGGYRGGRDRDHRSRDNGSHDYPTGPRSDRYKDRDADRVRHGDRGGRERSHREDRGDRDRYREGRRDERRDRYGSDHRRDDRRSERRGGEDIDDSDRYKRMRYE